MLAVTQTEPRLYLDLTEEGHWCVAGFKLHNGKHIIDGPLPEVEAARDLEAARNADGYIWLIWVDDNKLSHPDDAILILATQVASCAVL